MIKRCARYLKFPRTIVILAFLPVATTAFGAGISESTLVGMANVIADMLEKNRVVYLNRTLPILSTSFVELDDLKRSSGFGRLMGVMVASRLSQHGYRVSEVRLGKENLVVQEGNGETVLTREVNRLNGSHGAQAILVGTYSIANNRIFICSRIISTFDNTVISSYDTSFRMDASLTALLKQRETAEKDSDKVTVTPAPPKPKAPDRSAETPPRIPDPIQSGSVLLQLSNPLAAKIVQSQLARLGYYHAKIDGIWKQRSRSALMAFKRDNNLPSNPNWDMETQIALFNATVR